MQWRFIGANAAFIQDLRVLDLLEGNRFGDVHPAPYAKLREIDWIFIPASYKDPKADTARPLPELHNDLEALHAHLAGYGRFPIEILPDGLRICGYCW